jgi:hypothetical protein
MENACRRGWLTCGDDGTAKIHRRYVMEFLDTWKAGHVNQRLSPARTTYRSRHYVFISFRLWSALQPSSSGGEDYFSMFDSGVSKLGQILLPATVSQLKFPFFEPANFTLG